MIADEMVRSAGGLDDVCNLRIPHDVVGEFIVGRSADIYVVGREGLRIVKITVGHVVFAAGSIGRAVEPQIVYGAVQTFNSRESDFRSSLDIDGMLGKRIAIKRHIGDGVALIPEGILLENSIHRRSGLNYGYAAALANERYGHVVRKVFGPAGKLNRFIHQITAPRWLRKVDLARMRGTVGERFNGSINGGRVIGDAITLGSTAQNVNRGFGRGWQVKHRCDKQCRRDESPPLNTHMKSFSYKTNSSS
jgi:hypothetical protein